MKFMSTEKTTCVLHKGQAMFINILVVCQSRRSSHCLYSFSPTLQFMRQTADYSTVIVRYLHAYAGSAITVSP